MSKRKEFRKLLKEHQDYAKKNGFRLNPNQKMVDFLIGGLLEREKKYGEKYCPCRLVKNIKKEDNEIICPCIYCKKEIEEDGHCHCFLFVKNEIN
jgi:ferredoxin-thioredoxin reductase catalytic subunit